MKSYRCGPTARSVASALLIASASLASAGALATTVTAPARRSRFSTTTPGSSHVYFPLSVRSGTPPACATNIGGTLYRLVFDSTTPGGKSMLAGLITSMATGYQLWPLGSGDCGVDNANESLVNIYQFNN